jgi:uncharacterized protein
MITRQKDVSQSIRLLYLVVYLAFLFLINQLAFNQLLPLTNSKGLWFYSGASALILGSLLVTPFFTSPANAISYLITALFAVIIFDVPTRVLFDTLPRDLVIAFCFTMLAFCVANIIFKDSSIRLLHNLAEIGRVLADNLGSPRFVYAVIVIYALWEYHRESPMELFFIGIAGLIVVAQQPLETLGNIILRIIEVWRPRKSPNVVGCLVAFQAPGLLLIRQEDSVTINLGTCLLIADKHTPFKLCVALGPFGRDEGVLIRALEIQIPVKHSALMDKLAKKIPKGNVCILEKIDIEAFQEDIPLLIKLDSFIGIVAPDTATERLYFEVIQEKAIEQGRLVETLVGNKRVLYQVLDGLTKEEIVYQKNTYGFARGEAMQIGVWDDDKRKFNICNWIPQLNAPVFLIATEKPAENVNAIGYFPGSSFDVEIKNIDQLVTHNTAILGILGVGKSMLSIELVERMIKQGIKVVCIDLTNQYSNELSDFYDAEQEAKCLKTIQDAGTQDRKNISDNPEEGGSVPHLREAIYNDLAQFLKEDDPHKLKIYNPAEVTATKQEQEPKTYKDGANWLRSAGLWQVTPVEITRMISEICLSLLQGSMSEKARLCLVFEEAHSLIPEWNFVTVDSDKRAASGTARAILQGRKYGFGCLLITQRTANVSKTILNQCNTIFAMRSFDETGKDFLSNYIGLKYSSKLPTLQERQAVFFGRASSCENPVMIRLNDQADFRRIFRDPKEKQTSV